MSDAEIVELYNGAVEVPLNSPQIRYSKRREQWAPDRSWFMDAKPAAVLSKSQVQVIPKLIPTGYWRIVAGSGGKWLISP